VSIAMFQCGTGDHFSVEQGMLAELAQKYAVMTVCPVHHRGYAKFVIYLFHMKSFDTLIATPVVRPWELNAIQV